ncbi:PREDICTED: GDP-fucose protein O-fucosyltransferase 2 [Rhagoletis zephyria]|uniref:GDP-fucose protein O-fucosyltransferase 2 n=1 Tax=Rhagoletis zephyria TaxID=28612 RepID=UPI000811A53C|nr:PREDICTED: GDP-fucose protein O-fucosyltransferase 2 [Rhagoletis zephyria]
MWRILLATGCFCLLNLAAGSEIVDYSLNTCDRRHHAFNFTKGLPIDPHCPYPIKERRNSIYLLYDVNPPEGFNLRRDVYIRLAVFVRQLSHRKPFQNLRLVLPPWHRLYHWKSNHLQQHSLPWAQFFDVESMRRYAPVLDFPEFLAEIGQFGLQESPYVPVNQIFQLLHFEDMFEQGVFHEKFQVETTCQKDQYLQGYLLQQPMLLDNDFACVRYQGSVNLLEHLLRQHMKNTVSEAANDIKVYALLNAEIVLHDQWGDKEFWRSRRSMRFAASLVAIADEYRARVLNSQPAEELLQRPPMWEAERPYRKALGGDYLAVHFRRGDFVHGRQKTTPTLKSAATQIRAQMKLLNLTTVYIATDTNAMEITNLKAYLKRVHMRRFTPESLTQKALMKDGGQAIVDQLICAHARHFIGTFESTFTYRIYEEREILGFTRESTFNTLCKNATLVNCEKNTVWPIVY